MSLLELHNVSKSFNGASVLRDINLSIAKGEFVAIVGFSGAGKTTLISLIAGLLRPDTGTVSLNDKPVLGPGPDRGIVFQNYALFPHMTAAQNIAYGLIARGHSRRDAQARVEEMLALVKLGTFAGRYPKELSGGQQQRIALARALAIRPAVLLLDEPFAALDKNLRLDMQIEIKRIQRASGTTTLIVTHDQEEALSMADRVAVFNHGRLEQFAVPSEIYDHPASLFVNTFVGAANTFAGVVSHSADDQLTVRLGVGADIPARAVGGPVPIGSPVTVCIRPEYLRISNEAGGIRGTVEMGLPLGAVVIYEITLSDGRPMKISLPRQLGAELIAAGTSVTLVPLSPRAATAYHAATP